MTNIKNKLSDYLKSLPECPFTRIETDVFTVNAEGVFEDRNEVLCRYEPSAAKVQEYIDGSKKVSQSLGFYARCKKSTDARNFLQWIVDSIDEKEFLAEGVRTYCECLSLPQFISVDERGFTTYSMSVNTTFYEENK